MRHLGPVLDTLLYIDKMRGTEMKKGQKIMMHTNGKAYNVKVLNEVKPPKPKKRSKLQQAQDEIEALRATLDAKDKIRNDIEQRIRQRDEKINLLLGEKRDLERVLADSYKELLGITNNESVTNIVRRVGVAQGRLQGATIQTEKKPFSDLGDFGVTLKQVSW